MPRNIRHTCRALTALIVSSLAFSAGANVTVLTNANVIDGTGAPVQEGMTVIIEESVISAVTPRSLRPYRRRGRDHRSGGRLRDAGLLEHACALERAVAPQPRARWRKRRRQGHSSGRQCDGRPAPRLYRAAISRGRAQHRCGLATGVRRGFRARPAYLRERRVGLPYCRPSG